MPDAATAVHAFGGFQQFNPHLHLIATEGGFSGTGTFGVALTVEKANVQELFRHKALRMLKAEGKITDAVIENMMTLANGSKPYIFPFRRFSVY